MSWQGNWKVVKGGKDSGVDSYCHYCSGYGHRKAQCKLLDQQRKSKCRGNGAGVGYADVGEDDGTRSITTGSHKQRSINPQLNLLKV